MKVYEICVKSGEFVSRGDVCSRQSEDVVYKIFAADKDEAVSFANKIIGISIGHGSSIQSSAVFDSIQSMLIHENNLGTLKKISDVVCEAKHILTSIKINSFIVVKPSSGLDYILIQAEENGKVRLFTERFLYKKEDGSLTWINEETPMEALSLVLKLQKIFN